MFETAKKTWQKNVMGVYLRQKIEIEAVESVRNHWQKTSGIAPSFRCGGKDHAGFHSYNPSCRQPLLLWRHSNTTPLSFKCEANTWSQNRVGVEEETLNPLLASLRVADYRLGNSQGSENLLLVRRTLTIRRGVRPHLMSLRESKGETERVFSGVYNTSPLYWGFKSFWSLIEIKFFEIWWA